MHASLVRLPLIRIIFGRFFLRHDRLPAAQPLLASSEPKSALGCWHRAGVGRVADVLLLRLEQLATFRAVASNDAERTGRQREGSRGGRRLVTLCKRLKGSTVGSSIGG